jgi:hypothetical protein
MTLNDGVAYAITHAASADSDDLTISQTGAHDASLLLTSAGTGTDAISLNATAGSMVLDVASGEVIDLKVDGASTLIVGAASMVLKNEGTTDADDVTMTFTAHDKSFSLGYDGGSDKFVLASDTTTGANQRLTVAPGGQVSLIGTTATDAAALLVLTNTEAAAAADVMMTFTAHDKSFSLGYDGESDKFVLASDTTTGANQRLTVTSDGVVDISASGAATTIKGTLAVDEKATLSADVDVTGLAKVIGTASTDASALLVLTNTEAAAAADVMMTFTAHDKSFSLGYDGGIDKFVLASDTTTGTNQRLTVTSDGVVDVTDLKIGGGSISIVATITHDEGTGGTTVTHATTGNTGRGTIAYTLNGVWNVDSTRDITVQDTNCDATSIVLVTTQFQGEIVYIKAASTSFEVLITNKEASNYGNNAVVNFNYLCM